MQPLAAAAPFSGRSTIYRPQHHLAAAAPFIVAQCSICSFHFRHRPPQLSPDARPLHITQLRPPATLCRLAVVSWTALSSRAAQVGEKKEPSGRWPRATAVQAKTFKYLGLKPARAAAASCASFAVHSLMCNCFFDTEALKRNSGPTAV